MLCCASTAGDIVQNRTVAHPTRFERVTFASGGQRSSGGLRGREPEFAVGEKLKKRSLAAPISCSSY
jgi:hypothetical protein